MTTVISIGNQKGGVGKTTVTLCLASELVRLGRRVLVIDLDQQCNASMTLGGDPTHDIESVLLGRDRVKVAEAIVSTTWEGVDIVAGSQTIGGMDRDPDVMVAYRLSKALEEAGAALSVYDEILIDLPPALGTATASALIASDLVIAVTEPEPLSTAGLENFLNTVSGVRENARPNLRVYGVIVNKVRKTKENNFRLGELSEVIGEAMLQPLIPNRVAAVDVVSEMQPLHMGKSEGAKFLTDLFTTHARRLAEFDDAKAGS